MRLSFGLQENVLGAALFACPFKQAAFVEDQNENPKRKRLFCRYQGKPKGKPKPKARNVRISNANPIYP